MDETMDGQMFEVKPNFLLTNEHPNLVIMPMLHQVTGEKQEYIPLTLLNLSEDEAVYLKKGEILGHLEPCPIGYHRGNYKRGLVKFRGIRWRRRKF